MMKSCAVFQMQLLFSKSLKHQIAVSKLGSSATQSCQPYLLTLLTHQASWGTLHRCLENLLAECNENYDPTAVLDFLWALTYHPKLWQGREKCTPKHHSPEDILGLTPPQVRLCDFLLQGMQYEVLQNMEVHTDVYSDAIHTECMKCYVLVIKLSFMYA